MTTEKNTTDAGPHRVIDPSGAGNSSLLNTISGSAVDVDDGCIEVVGDVVTALGQELLLSCVESARHSMGLSAVELWVNSGTTFRRLVSSPERPRLSVAIDDDGRQFAVNAGIVDERWAAMWLTIGTDRATSVRVVPVMSGAELLGLLVVERLVHDPPFSMSDEHGLLDLAHQLSLALRHARLDTELREQLNRLRAEAAELQAARARIVAAADHERQRIERALHDGARQHLVALAIGLSLARSLVGGAPDVIAGRLDRLGADVKVAMAELRELAHGIYPPLAENGLPHLLHTAAIRLGLPVSLEADGLRRTAPETEATVFFCCLEALQSVATHAGPDKSVAVRLSTDDGGLSFEIRADAAGFEHASTETGYRLTSMIDRIGAAGGTFGVTSEPGAGTRVEGFVPDRGTDRPSEGDPPEQPI